MRKNDWIIAGIVLAVSCVLLLSHRAVRPRSGDGTVGIYRGDERLASYPLSEDRREEFLSPEGKRNVVVIRDGEAYMEDADCPDKLCIKQGRIRERGQAVICLPNGLTVVIEEGKEPGLDGVTG